jgi:hypothetical protein
MRGTSKILRPACAIHRLVVTISEKFLAAVAGWPVVFEARKIRAAGRVKRAQYDPPLLKGAVRAGSRLFASGLRIVSEREVENICSCRISQVEGDGMICAHSVAVALEVLHGPVAEQSPESSG